MRKFEGLKLVAAGLTIALGSSACANVVSTEARKSENQSSVQRVVDKLRQLTSIYKDGEYQTPEYNGVVITSQVGRRLLPNGEFFDITIGSSGTITTRTKAILPDPNKIVSADINVCPPVTQVSGSKGIGASPIPSAKSGVGSAYISCPDNLKALYDISFSKEANDKWGEIIYSQQFTPNQEYLTGTIDASTLDLSSGPAETIVQTTDRQKVTSLDAQIIGFVSSAIDHLESGQNVQLPNIHG